MSNDIVERLRTFDIYDYADADKICREAAARIAKMTEVMELALRYFENRIDVNDGDYGVPEANQEMYLYTYLKEVLDSD